MARIISVRSLRRRGDVTVVDFEGTRRRLTNDADTKIDLDRADCRAALARVWHDVIVSGAPDPPA